MLGTLAHQIRTGFSVWSARGGLTVTRTRRKGNTLAFAKRSCAIELQFAPMTYETLVWGVFQAHSARRQFASAAAGWSCRSGHRSAPAIGAVFIGFP